jgi:hypothetical protein
MGSGVGDGLDRRSSLRRLTASGPARQAGGPATFLAMPRRPHGCADMARTAVTPTASATAETVGRKSLALRRKGLAACRTTWVARSGSDQISTGGTFNTKPAWGQVYKRAETPHAIPNVQAEPQAVALPEAKPSEKVNAVNESEATDDWLRLSDRNFVFKVYETISATKFPLTKAEASRVYGLTATDATVFIRTGIFDFAQRDRVERQRRRDAWAETVRLRREVAIDAEILVDDEMVSGTDHTTSCSGSTNAHQRARR